MNTPGELHSAVRLLLAGMASLLLLFWTLIGRGLPPLIVPPGSSVSPWPMLFTALLATMILVVLFPIVLRGSAGERWMSIIVGVFPSLVLCLIGLWLAGVVSRGGF
jgi:hypothetical protein